MYNLSYELLNFVPKMKPSVYFTWLKGLTYQEAWDIQTSIHKGLIESKMQKKYHIDDSIITIKQKHQLIFCEHDHVFTLGKSGSMDHLLLTDSELKEDNIEFFKINRGGDITYHGPGQITGYPVFDLEEFFTDVHRYVRTIEEAIIVLISKYGLNGIRIAGYTGVWLEPDNTSDQFRKICAIGVHLSRWVSMHGFAFNVNTDLSYFEKIIPCGIVDKNKTVTSLSKETGNDVDIEKVGIELADIFSQLFDFELISEI